MTSMTNTGKPKAYIEELVNAYSDDGIRHGGVVIRPVNGQTKPYPILWMHGHTGRFYEPHAIIIGRELAARGYTFISGNNRGHDFGAMLHKESGENFLGGACWEKLDESPLDYSGWLAFCVEQGFPQAVLLGHSLGAMKADYYCAIKDDPRIRGLVLASPPMKLGAFDPTTFERALGMVAEGKGEDLIYWEGPNGFVNRVSAQTVTARTNAMKNAGATPQKPVISLVHKIKAPLYIILGGDEEWIGDKDDLAEIVAAATSAKSVCSHFVPGADHLYTGHEVEVAEGIAKWVETL